MDSNSNSRPRRSRNPLKSFIRRISHSPVGAAPATRQANPDINIWEDKLLLSLDGDPIRGLSSLFILQALMEKIAQMEQQNPQPAYHSFSPAPYKDPRPRSAQPSDNASTGSGSRSHQNDSSSSMSEADLKAPEYRYLPCHYFDFIAGTSTGGLIAMMLGRLRMTVGHCIEEYIELGGDIFGKPRMFNARSVLFWNRGKYEGSNVEKVVEKVGRRYNPWVQNELWSPVLFKSPERLCKTMVFATEESEMEPYIFRSYDHKRKAEVPMLNQSHLAAPGYFNPLEINDVTFLDGGLVANNPSVYAFNEISLLQGNKAPALVLSIGTGEKEKRSFKTLEKSMKHWKPFISHQPNNRIAESQSADIQMTEVRDQREHRPEDRFKYQRLTVGLDFGLGWMKLDEWKRDPSSERPANDPNDVPKRYIRKREYFLEKSSKHHDTVRFLETRTNFYLESVRENLDQLARVLVNKRRLRSKTPQWEHFATGDTWQCRDCSGSLFYTRDELRTHLAHMHGNRAVNIDRDCRLPY
ncbi:hypothetical protein LTR10_021449 [Elasticomyces elasticus]|uniref:PNPLA domain-containing protein n=1 Tax=Exophiala sideris TaxID=1016849 RepID=A0ABR0JM31_9EURO|nr:hypothetical protein LTR10_021449 [Elasticomyces elasticus]KAK5036615.1 hypothetical protein LTS07_002342 [Exophiala sideris]KAK5041554.1 hypothetical protein LTR13_002221 [Exophiala sideris]KAK5066998.1 hypothetical protein LTR69_002346 [Exophiala sideris]KAK5185057.1 hypothetical protein LTR44_002903 [Eurotiomycetes sp. CCFEE 6388]